MTNPPHPITYIFFFAILQFFFHFYCEQILSPHFYGFGAILFYIFVAFSPIQCGSERGKGSIWGREDRRFAVRWLTPLPANQCCFHPPLLLCPSKTYISTMAENSALSSQLWHGPTRTAALKPAQLQQATVFSINLPRTERIKKIFKGVIHHFLEGSCPTPVIQDRAFEQWLPTTACQTCARSPSLGSCRFS